MDSDIGNSENIPSKLKIEILKILKIILKINRLSVINYANQLKFSVLKSRN